MSASDDFAEAVSSLGDISQVWNLFAVVYSKAFDGVMVFPAILAKVQVVGAGILVAFFLLRILYAFSSQMESEDGELNLLGIVAETVLVAILMAGYEYLILLFPYIFDGLAHTISSLFETDLRAQIAGALTIIGNEKATDFKFWTGDFINMSLMGIFAAITSYAAMVLLWVIGKLQSYLFCFWYLLGPVMLPTLIFPPFRKIGATWFSSLMGTSFISIVGSIYYFIIVRSAWLPKIFSAGAGADYLTCMVYSLICLVSLISVPFVSLGLWGGIERGVVGAVGGAKKAMKVGTGSYAYGAQQAKSFVDAFSKKPAIPATTPVRGP